MTTILFTLWAFLFPTFFRPFLAFLFVLDFLKLSFTAFLLRGLLCWLFPAFFALVLSFVFVVRFSLPFMFLLRAWSSILFCIAALRVLPRIAFRLLATILGDIVAFYSLLLPVIETVSLPIPVLVDFPRSAIRLRHCFLLRRVELVISWLPIALLEVDQLFALVLLSSLNGVCQLTTAFNGVLFLPWAASILVPASLLFLILLWLVTISFDHIKIIIPLLVLQRKVRGILRRPAVLLFLTILVSTPLWLLIITASIPALLRSRPRFICRPTIHLGVSVPFFTVSGLASGLLLPILATAIDRILIWIWRRVASLKNLLPLVLDLLVSWWHTLCHDVPLILNHDLFSSGVAGRRAVVDAALV